MPKNRSKDDDSYYAKTHFSQAQLFIRKIRKKYSRISISDKLSFVGLIISIGLGLVGMWLSLTISNQQQTIKGFDTLLANNKKMIIKLNSGLDILNEQLKLNRQKSEKESYYDSIQFNSNLNRLWGASYSIQHYMYELLPQGISEEEKLTFTQEQIHDAYSKVNSIFQEQLANPALLSNIELFSVWQGTQDVLISFITSELIIDGGKKILTEEKIIKNVNGERILDSLLKHDFPKKEKVFQQLFFIVKRVGDATRTYLKKTYPQFKKY